jgi:YVTN family beta-propeller protein
MKRLCLLLAALCGPAFAAPLAYVPNEKSGSISVIDTASGAVLREFAAGQRPRGVAADPAGARLYVADAGGSALLMIDTASGATARSIPLGKSPEGVSASADGRYVAVAVEESNSVALIDARSGQLLADIPVQGKNPEHAVFSPDGRWLLVSAEEAEQVDVIDVEARRQRGSVAWACGRAASDSVRMARAYVACELANAVYVVDMASRATVARIPAGRNANGIAVHPADAPCTSPMASTAA